MGIYVGNKRYAPYIGDKRREVRNKKALPYDAQIEYLESNGTQYIDTGVYGNKNLKVEFSVQELERGQNFAVFGCFGSNNRCYYLYQSNTGIWQIGFGSYYSTTIQTNTNRNTFLFDNFNVYINGSLMRTFSSITFTTPHTLLLYSMHNDSGGIYNAKPKKMWYCKMWESGVLIKDFIPVRVGQVGYMYDKVSGQLFGNEGTGDFTLGPDKT